jgi:hypothetical protein
VNLARAFGVYEELLAAEVEASIHARRLEPEPMEFTITLSLVDRTPQQLAEVASIVDRHELDLQVDDFRLATLT